MDSDHSSDMDSEGSSNEHPTLTFGDIKIQAPLEQLPQILALLKLDGNNINKKKNTRKSLPSARNQNQDPTQSIRPRHSTSSLSNIPRTVNEQETEGGSGTRNRQPYRAEKNGRHSMQPRYSPKKQTEDYDDFASGSREDYDNFHRSRPPQTGSWRQRTENPSARTVTGENAGGGFETNPFSGETRDAPSNRSRQWFSPIPQDEDFRDTSFDNWRDRCYFQQTRDSQNGSGARQRPQAQPEFSQRAAYHPRPMRDDDRSREELPHQRRTEDYANNHERISPNNDRQNAFDFERQDRDSQRPLSPQYDKVIKQETKFGQEEKTRQESLVKRENFQVALPPQRSLSPVRFTANQNLPKAASVNYPKRDEPVKPRATADNYLEVLGLYEKALWPSFVRFYCPMCGLPVESLRGYILKGCLIHPFCGDCLVGHVKGSRSRDVLCPLSNATDPCNEISADEIQALLTEDERQLHLTKPTRVELENDPMQVQVFLMDRDLIPNLEAAVCPVCMEDIPVNEGITPKNCLVHAFCKPCLIGAITHSDIPLVQCPGEDCDCNLTDREIRLLVSDEDYVALHAKGVSRVLASNRGETFHCKKPDCEGAWFYEGDGRFTCPACKSINCTECDVIHESNQTCEEYKSDKRIKQENDQSELETEEFFKNALKNNKAMICPQCKAIVQKIDGCDGMKCTVCATELCWATKGARWGPAGKGDLSGGCRCNFQGKRCAPNCQNCH